MSDYIFAATVQKVALSTKKQRQLAGYEGEAEFIQVDVPLATITLTFHNEKAREVAAALAAYQGKECTLSLEGARQLNL